MASQPRNPACPLCSKPIRPGSLVLFEHGELLHIHCRSRRLEATALDAVARAEVAQKRATRLVEENSRLRRVRRTDPRPVCGEPVTTLDWRPSIEWLAVEGCQCRGFFVWTPLLERRLPNLSAEDRGTLSMRIRDLRASRGEAWLTTRDGTTAGALVIRDARPDRAR